MVNQQMTDELLRVASENPDGFTINVNTFQPVTHGWAVALLETQNCFGREGAMKVIDVALKKTAGIVGGWNNQGDYYFDAVLIVESESEATRLGIENEQIGIYEIHTNRYKDLLT
ncbi:fructokinase [Pseudarcicella hirudinis]|uniref:Fructokinase n=1 Tax=Pseudarcicella hirudinis TaxID=1079859 RepID=A0A1I5MYP3_9BACT|nr:hypothetical protein [Pseudarcicella hirudinis]SFP14191.1 fructokinase [Pseudarcicella hirudinis]